MSTSLQLSLIALVSLLLLITCQPQAESEVTLTAASRLAPPTDSPAAPTPIPPPTPAAVTPTPPTERAADADVLHVRAVQAVSPATGSGQGETWTFHVTVQHPDTGWEDYADGWDVLTLDGTVLKPDSNSLFTRPLLHPHVGEQPFTRSQSGILIPPDVTQVRVRAHDSVDGYGGHEVLVDLTVSSGTDFEVERIP